MHVFAEPYHAAAVTCSGSAKNVLHSSSYVINVFQSCYTTYVLEALPGACLKFATCELWLYHKKTYKEAPSYEKEDKW